MELRRRAATAALIDAAAGERAAAGKPRVPFRTRETASPGLRLDLRGCLVEEALEKLDRYLDTASRAELPWVHIIHGKGTGALRRAVREVLTDHPLVSAYEPAAMARAAKASRSPDWCRDRLYIVRLHFVHRDAVSAHQIQLPFIQYGTDASHQILVDRDSEPVSGQLLSGGHVVGEKIRNWPV